MFYYNIIISLLFSFISDMPDSLRELQRKIPGRDRNALKENLLSQDVCVTLLQDNKLAIRRAEMVGLSTTLLSRV